MKPKHLPRRLIPYTADDERRWGSSVWLHQQPPRWTPWNLGWQTEFCTNIKETLHTSLNNFFFKVTVINTVCTVTFKTIRLEWPRQILVCQTNPSECAWGDWWWHVPATRVGSVRGKHHIGAKSTQVSPASGDTRSPSVQDCKSHVCDVMETPWVRTSVSLMSINVM